MGLVIIAELNVMVGVGLVAMRLMAMRLMTGIEIRDNKVMKKCQIVFKSKICLNLKRR